MRILASLFRQFSGEGRQRSFSKIARRNADGTAERTTTFNPGTGLGTLAGGVTHIAVQADGKILLAGGFSSVNGQPRHGIVRLLADGMVESTNTFNPGTGSNSGVSAMAVQADGKILLGGAFTKVNEQPRNHLARLNADGTLESTATFNPAIVSTSDFISSIAVQSDGKIVLGGNFAAGDPPYRMARLNSDGTPDASFVRSGFDYGDEVRCVAVQADGTILLGGRFPRQFSGLYGIGHRYPAGTASA